MSIRTAETEIISFAVITSVQLEAEIRDDDDNDHDERDSNDELESFSPVTRGALISGARSSE